MLTAAAALTVRPDLVMALAGRIEDSYGRQLEALPDQTRLLLVILTPGAGPGRRWHRQAGEAKATGGATYVMWAKYAALTNGYSQSVMGPSKTGELTRTTSSMFSGRKNATPCS